MKPTRFYSKKQEKKVNDYLGLTTVSNSGATAFNKGDGQDENILIECKTLTKAQKSRTIQKEWFTTQQKETFAMGKSISAVAFDFGDGDNYVAVSIQDFRELYEAWCKLYEEE